MPFSTASKPAPSVKPIKPKIIMNNGEVLTAVPLRVKGLPKPLVKEEPMDESPDIQQFDSFEGEVLEEEKENIKGIKNYRKTCVKRLLSKKTENWFSIPIIA